MDSNGLKLMLYISGIGAGLNATICLLRLCLPLEWPVVLKYQRWEYGVKVIGGAAWAIWVGLILKGM